MGTEDMTDILCAGDDCRIRDDCQRFAVPRRFAAYLDVWGAPVGLAPGAIWLKSRPDGCDMYLPPVPHASPCPVQLELF